MKKAVKKSVINSTFGCLGVVRCVFERMFFGTFCDLAVKLILELV